MRHIAEHKQTADVVDYIDRRVKPEALEYAMANAQLIQLGRKPNGKKETYADVKRMHPMRAAGDSYSVASEMRREMIGGHVKDLEGNPIPLSREDKLELSKALAEFEVATIRNAMKLTGVTGWEQIKAMDVDQALIRIRQVSPQAHLALEHRLDKKKVAPRDQWQSNWQQLQSRTQSTLKTLRGQAEQSPQLVAGQGVSAGR